MKGHARTGHILQYYPLRTPTSNEVFVLEMKDYKAKMVLRLERFLGRRRRGRAGCF